MSNFVFWIKHSAYDALCVWTEQPKRGYWLTSGPAVEYLGVRKERLPDALDRSMWEGGICVIGEQTRVCKWLRNAMGIAKNQIIAREGGELVVYERGERT